MICGLCEGAQNLFCIHDKQYEWYECSGCGGTGTRILYSPPTIMVRQKSPKPLKKVE